MVDWDVVQMNQGLAILGRIEAERRGETPHKLIFQSQNGQREAKKLGGVFSVQVSAKTLKSPTVYTAFTAWMMKNKGVGEAEIFNI